MRQVIVLRHILNVRIFGEFKQTPAFLLTQQIGNTTDPGLTITVMESYKFTQI